MKTSYTNLYQISELQQKIMRYIDYWVHVEKTPIPRNEIIKQMNERGCKSITVISALNGLIKIGYIRRAITISNKTNYVQLKKI